MHLPKNVIYILQQLNQGGHEAYIVGGCVRDCLMGRSPKDWDITTSALPPMVKGLFSHTYDTGIKHGTVTVLLGKTSYEVTTYRIDGAYSDSRHPDTVRFTPDLTEDLRRRDFTMNAIAYHPERGFCDPYGGQADIQSAVIRGVGNPNERFQEDALRMLRGVRFAVQLGFSIEENTLTAIHQNTPLLQKISAERIREELNKLLLGQFPQKAPLLWETGLLRQISLSLSDALNQSGRELVTQLSHAPMNAIVRWSLFLRHADNPKALLAQLKFDHFTSRAVLLLLKHLPNPIPQTPYGLRRLASVVGIDRMHELLLLHSLVDDNAEAQYAKATFAEILENKDCLTLSDLAINGEDLLALGCPRGKAVGEKLAALLDLVHQTPSANTPEYLKKEALRLCQHSQEAQ